MRKLKIPLVGSHAFVLASAAPASLEPKAGFRRAKQLCTGRTCTCPPSPRPRARAPAWGRAGLGCGCQVGAGERRGGEEEPVTLGMCHHEEISRPPGLWGVGWIPSPSPAPICPPGAHLGGGQGSPPAEGPGQEPLAVVTTAPWVTDGQEQERCGLGQMRREA